MNEALSSSYLFPDLLGLSVLLYWCQIVRCQIVCFYYVGAKLSWCQIVRCQIVLVPNCPGAKLSTFIILVPNCPLLLSWCQIVRFYSLGAKLSALLSWCQIVQCQFVRCQIVLQSALPAVGRLWPSRRKISTYEVLSKWCGR